jgi:hypothetical protein
MDRLRQHVEEMELAKKVGLHFNPVAEEIAKLEELLAIQDQVMDALSRDHGDKLIRLYKLRGEI